MAKFKVVFTDNIFPDLSIEQTMLAAVDAEVIEVPRGEDPVPYIKDADAVVNTYMKVPAEMIDAMEKCKLVIRNGIGIDPIDVEACTRRGIMVANVPHYCSEEVAVHTMALMLAVTRKLKVFRGSMEKGVWGAKPAMPIFSLENKTLGLIGFGKIPRLVAEKAKVFGMKVMAYDPFVTEEDMAGAGVQKGTLEEVAQAGDVVSIHCPLNAQTRGIFDRKMFERMKPTAFLINAARGPVVVEKDLISALEDGLIAGAGLDVLEKDEITGDHPLLKMDNVILTPHVAWYSEESIVRRREQTMESVVLVLQGKKPVSLCNRV